VKTQQAGDMRCDCRGLLPSFVQAWHAGRWRQDESLLLAPHDAMLADLVGAADHGIVKCPVDHELVRVRA
jgi:hypothetical protein